MSQIQRGVRAARRRAKIARRRREANKRGIASAPPNYIYLDLLGPESTVIDVGCGFEAEFARHLIATHGVRAFGVDPTRKHAPWLHAIERQVDRFKHLPLAVAAVDGVLTFHESVRNESGSLFDTHTNVTNGDIRSYEVEAVTLPSLLQRIGVYTVDLLKLDLEGAEYALLSDAGWEDLACFRQLFVEFHHHAIAERTQRDTQEMIAKVERRGFKSFSLDDHNVLFYR
jgi:FkbM family methyltransferase